MRKFTTSVLAAAALFFSHSLALAEVSVPHIFSDHMVLARDMKVPVWGKADPGESITVTLAGKSATTTAGPDGKWRIDLTNLPATDSPTTLTIAGKSNTLTLSDVLIGEVWLASGQSNMDFRVAKTKERYWCGLANEADVIAAANHPSIRMFIADFTPRDEPQSDVPGKWWVCSPETVGEFSAVGYLFALELQKNLKTPVGIVLTSYGASTAQAWISTPDLKSNPRLSPLLDDYAKAVASFDTGDAQKAYEIKLQEWEAASEKAKADNKPAPKKPGQPRDPHKDQHNPAVLYNGMVAPLVSYAIKGVIWYQGESNGNSANIYLDLMTALIANWRRDWAQGDFPFLSVQLAGLKPPTTQPIESSQIASVRDAQLRSLAIPNTALATAVDIGDVENVHPKNKQEVARRLSLAALHLAYHQPTPHSGPTVASTKTEGASLRITFANTFGGLKAKGDKLTVFALQDDAGKWHTADAKIEGDSVLLSSPEVPHPKAARYAWANNPPISLYSAADLPAYPFRTDD